jgi:uncharacterized membrane protein
VSDVQQSKDGSTAPESSFEDALGTKGLHRLNDLSDGIFAFAMTLLALDLVTPVIVGQATDASLAAALVNEFHSFLGFFVSFWVISMLWLGHHRIIRYLKSSDTGLLRLNLAFLFFIVLVPFATRVLNYGFLPIALDFFASILIGASLLSTIIWTYASHPGRHLLDERTPQDTIKWLSNRGLLSAAIYALSIFLAFVNPYITLASWIVVLPILVFLDRRYSKLSGQEAS